MALKLMNDKRGSAFLYVTMAVFIIVLLGGITVSLLTYEIRVNKLTEKRIEAKYLAEAGIEHAMLGTGASGSGVGRDTDGNKLYEYSYSISGGTINITSYGFLENRARLMIECSIRDDIVTKWKETTLD